MSVPPTSVMAVVRAHDRWGVEVDGEVMALARSRGAAAELARDAARILRRSGAEVRVRAPREHRSFRQD